MNTTRNVTIGIIGTGNIGTSLAALFTGNGYEAILLAVGETYIANSRVLYDTIYDTLEERKLVSKKQREVCAKRLSYTTEYADLSEVSLIFECAFEDMDTKYGIYREVERHCGKLEALASTTSAMSPDDLSKGMEQHPEKLMVAHPFNPPHLVPFVELVKSECTSDAAADLVFDILESCGRKVCVMNKCAPGFIANRLQHALLREAMYMVDQGMVSAQDIDKALQFSFMPRYTSVGLFEHHDCFGLDMTQNVQNYLYPHLCDSKGAAYMVTSRVEKGDLGQKTGRGIYQWDTDSIADFNHRAAEPYWKYFNWRLPE